MLLSNSTSLCDKLMFRANNVMFRLLWKVTASKRRETQGRGKRFSAISKYLALQCIATGYQRTELRDVINET